MRTGATGAPRSRPTAVIPEGGRLRLFDAVSAFLTAACTESPTIVVLDDLHAGDEPSLLLLRFLGDALAEARILLVASAIRDADKRVRELSDVFAELARVGRRIPLRGLAAADIEAYVATVTESTVSRRAVARLHEVTGGNPFFLGEAVRLLAAGDTLARLDERTGDPLLRIPEEVLGPDPSPRGGPPARGGRDAPARGRDRPRVRPASAPAREPVEHRPPGGRARGGGRRRPDRRSRGDTTSLLLHPRPRARDAVRRSPSAQAARAAPDGGSPARERAQRRPRSSPVRDRASPVSRVAARRCGPSRRLPRPRGRSRVRRARLRGCRDPLPARAGAARGRGLLAGRAARARPRLGRRAVALGGRQRRAADARARDRRLAALGRARDARRARRSPT